MKNNDEGKKQLEIIRKAYDLTVKEHDEEIDPLAKVPKEFKESKRFKEFQNLTGLDSSNDAYKIFLNPSKGMKFLDIGSCANLSNYKLYEWPSEYYGVDISPALIEAMKGFVKRKNIKIGGLYVADVANLPFKDNFFDIAAIIGVLEYFDLDYIKKALAELHRVLKPGGRLVVDMPNLEHPLVDVMFELEKYLGRPRLTVPSKNEFEAELKRFFQIDKTDGIIMIKYFVKKI